MNVLPDTCVWSLMLRRRAKDLSAPERTARFILEDLIRNDAVVLIGPVRQEVLSGISDVITFDRLRARLRAFQDEPILTEDYEEAARCGNRCRAAGLASSVVDMLICAASMRLAMPVFTTDPDFQRYAAHLEIQVPTLVQLQQSLQGGNGDE